jgi:predicted O-methyltransferase YrrM
MQEPPVVKSVTSRKWKMTTLEDIHELTAGVASGTSPRRGEELHRFVRDQRPRRILELGFASGVSTLYLASALEANGEGRVTSVDTRAALAREPRADALLDRTGLAHRVELVYEETSYTWFLQRILREQLRDGRIEPLYDFAFLDGAHLWDPDALAFLLLDRLLRPGGWLLLDDLDWAPDACYELPASQAGFPHVREVWELLAVTHPDYGDFRTDGQWGWARKSADARPAERVVQKRDLVGELRDVSALVRQRLRRR